MGRPVRASQTFEADPARRSEKSACAAEICCKSRILKGFATKNRLRWLKMHKIPLVAPKSIDFWCKPTPNAQFATRVSSALLQNRYDSAFCTKSRQKIVMRRLPRRGSDCINDRHMNKLVAESIFQA